MEIVDELPEVNDLATGTEKGCQTSAESNGIISIDDVSKLFKGRNLAFVSTLSDDGSPHITPVWSDIDEDKNILINTSETSAKKRHIDKDPRVAISIVEQYNPYNMVSIKGMVTEQTTSGADEHLRTLAQKYLWLWKVLLQKTKKQAHHIESKTRENNGPVTSSCFLFPSIFSFRKSKSKSKQ